MQQIRLHAAVRRRALFLLTSSNEVRPFIGSGLQGDYSGSGGKLAGSGYSLTFWITGGGWSLSRIILYLLAARERVGKRQALSNQSQQSTRKHWQSVPRTARSRDLTTLRRRERDLCERNVCNTPHSKDFAQ
jgi:hypothetical protein